MYTVMIAEDEAIYRKALTVFVDWEKLGCRIIYIASDGSQVLDNIKAIAPDILITDIRMPGADGLEIASYIYQHELPVAVILLTAYADFSYARAAFRYQVVDYVVKSGMFEELEAAVEKAKIAVDDKRSKEETGGKAESLQSLYKAVFDGSILLQDDMERRLKTIQLKKKYGQVLLYFFQSRAGLSESKQNRVSRSLQNFFAMAYEEEMVCAIPMSEERMAVLLQSDVPLSKSWLIEKCEQTADMMDSFMKFYIHVGISSRFTKIQDLRRAYEETLAIFDSSFLDDIPSISFYEDIHATRSSYDPQLENMNIQICQTTRMGRKEEAVRLFKDMLRKQRSKGYSANAIKASGILILNECKKMLKEFGGSLYETTNLTPSITKKVSDSTSCDGYASLMTEVLAGTAEYFGRIVDKRDYLVKCCKEYIEQHYEQELSVAEIARSLGTSSSYLSRIYREITGSTIIYDLNRKRVDMAKYYLQEKQLKVYEVADLLSFKNVTYFSHIFKSYTGMSPREFQNLVQERK